MSIIGALLGFAITAIVVGAIGAIVSAVSWGIAADYSRNTRPAKRMLFFFLVLLFVGAIITGGLG